MGRDGKVIWGWRAHPEARGPGSQALILGLWGLGVGEDHPGMLTMGEGGCQAAGAVGGELGQELRTVLSSSLLTPEAADAMVGPGREGTRCPGSPGP